MMRLHKVLFRRAGWVFLCLLILLSAFYLIFNRFNLPAPHLAGENGQGKNSADPIQIGARGPLTLTFSVPVQSKDVETGLTLDPAVPGRFIWTGGDQPAVSFWPALPLAPGSRFTLHLAAGVHGQNGMVLRRAVSWSVEVRQSEVLLLSPSRAPELWRISADGQKRTRLTSTGGKVFDYTVSEDGSRIIYAARNDQQGIDLWEVDREGHTPHLLLPCSADWCSSPALSPDGNVIAYVRRQASGIAGSAPGVPHLWRLDLKTLATDVWFVDPNICGSAPAWSPDGRYLAFADTLADGVRVVDLQAKTDFLYPAGEGASLVWSPDSLSIYFTHPEGLEELPRVAIDAADVRTHQIRQVLGGDESTDAEDFSAPVFSLDGQWRVVARRQVTGSPGKQLWLSRADGTQGQFITADALANYAGYHWNPAGTLLVYQRLELGASGSLPKVELWSRADNTTIGLSEDAFQPDWLP